jgi:hypothetical protein
VKRYTFVVQIHPEGISTLENLSTHERIRIEQLAEVGPKIESWLAETSEEVKEVAIDGSPASDPPRPRSARQ